MLLEPLSPTDSVSVEESITLFFPLESLWVSTDGFISNRKTQNEMEKPMYVLHIHVSPLKMCIKRGSPTNILGELRCGVLVEEGWRESKDIWRSEKK